PRAEDKSSDSSAYMAHAVLDFTLDIERLAELTVMVLIGALLSAATFSAFSLGIAATLLFSARPYAVWPTRFGPPHTRTQRGRGACFGIGGAGFPYYWAS